MGCQSHPYKSISVETDWGAEIIPGSCSAWTDECNTYCRLDALTSYKKLPLENKCTAVRSTCIDNNPEKLKPCYGICAYAQLNPSTDPQISEKCE
ncbi:MAG: hypothetical protein OXM55_06445 [Bdellovibrionales bacterium]|nr:hypothetical protein [Bdellovibrionales bacterium]